MQLAFASTLALGTAAGFTAPAKAQNWIGGAAGNWGTAGNWSGGVIPDSGTAVVRIDNGNLGQSTTVNLDTDRSVGQLFIDAGDALNVQNNRRLYIHGGASTNNGQINLNAVGNFTYIFIRGDNNLGTNADDTVLSGTGKLTLNGSGNNYIYADISANNRLVNDTGHTIEGGGNIGNNQMAFTNKGLVDANNNSGALIFDINDGNDLFINTGTMRASNGGTLRIFNSTLMNAGGTVSALNGSVVELRNGVIDGGTISTSGTGRVRNDGGWGYLKDLTITTGSVYQSTNNRATYLDGTITNNGTMELNGGGSFTYIFIRGDNNLATTADDVVLTGNGKLTLNGSSTNFIYADVSGQNRLINDTNHTIEGGGNIGSNTLAFTNKGLVDANNGLLNFDINDPAADFINTGTMRASNGGTLRITNSNLTNTGGTVSALADSFVELTGGTIIGGTISTTGTGRIRTGSNSGALNNVAITTGSVYQTTNGRITYLSNLITNNGTMELNGGGSFTYYFIRGDNDLTTTTDDLVLTGNGKLTLNGSGTNFIYADQSSQNRLINDTNHTIEGGGNIGSNSLAFTNKGLVDANNGLLNFDINDPAADFINTGTMRASNGGTLRFTSSALTNVGGTVSALNGSLVELNGAAIIGGTLSTTGTGRIRSLFSGGDLSSVTITSGSVYETNNNTRTYLRSSITNNGRMELNGGASFTYYFIRGDNDLATSGDDVVLTGNGKLVMNSAATNYIYADQNSQNRLVNDTNHTIEGGGNIGNNTLAFTNKGLVDANNVLLNFDINDPADNFINTGTMRASNGGTLRLTNSALTNVGGTVSALADSFVELNGSTIIGGTLSSTGTGRIRTAISNAALNSVTITAGSVYQSTNALRTFLFNTITNNGTMELNGVNNFTYYFIRGDDNLATTGDDVVLTGTGKLVMNGSDLNYIYADQNGNNRLVNDTNHTIEGGGNLGWAGRLEIVNKGLINGNNNTLTFVGGGDGTFNRSTGIVQASGTGTVNVSGTAFVNEGTVQALDGRTVNFDSVVTNNSGAGTLNGGTWKAIGNGSTVSIFGNAIGTLANGADVTLSGAGSVIRTESPNLQSFDNTLHTVGANSALRVLGNRDFTVVANSGNYSNSGKTQLGGGTFNANGTFNNTSTGEVYGFGTITDTILNSGLVRAVGGTLTVTRVDGQSGTVQVDAGASLSLAQASDADFLVHNGTNLNLGGAFTVTNDYTNANFGTGNSFNARANVTGSAINAVAGTSQTVTGANVTGGTTPTPTLDLGNVRVGQSVARDFTVNNVSTNDTVVLRGALQTSVNGGNITDGRLTGAGITAQNFTLNPDASQTYGVTFNATSSGALSNQKVAVVNNFDNVAEQVISITGTAWDAANGDLKPGSINLGNFRVGSNVVLSGNLNVENTATGAFAERLGIDSVSASGIAGLTANNALGATRVNPGATANNAVGVSLNTTGLTKGVKNGSVSAQFLTDGAGTSGLAVANTNQDSTSVSATGYALANPTVQGNLQFGNVLKDSVQERFLTVTNTGSLGDQFQEALNARFKNVPLPTGIAQLSGAINLLAAGATNSNTLKVKLDTSSTGAVTATVFVEVESDGTGTSGLGVFSLGDREVQVLGSVEMDGIVGDRAIGQVAPTIVNFGARREGQSATQSVTISNVQNGPREGLNASFTGASGAITTAGGPITGLGYTTETTMSPAVDNSTMSVGLNTSNALAFGNRSGTVTVDFKSNGEFDGGNVFDIADGTVEVQGTVYQKAKSGAIGTIALGNHRVGAGVVSANVSVSNTASATGGFTEDLGVALDNATNGLQFTNVAGGKVGAASSKNAQVSNNFNTSGNKGGTVTLNYTTEEVNGSGLGSESIGQATFNVTGKAYQTAEASLTGSLDFGVMRKGDNPAAKAVNVANTASGALVDSLKATASGGPSGLIILNPATIQVAAGSSGNLNFDLNTSTSGVIDGTVGIALASTNADMADLDLGTENVAVKATITEAAKAKVQGQGGAASFSGGGTSYTVNFGTVNADTGIKSFDLSILNDIVASAFAETLGGSFQLSASDFTFTGASTFSGLMGGAAHALSVSFDTAGRAAGQFLGSLVFRGLSSFTGLSDLALSDITIAVRATIAGEPGEVSEPGTLLLITGGGLLLWRLRRQKAIKKAA